MDFEPTRDRLDAAAEALLREFLAAGDSGGGSEATEVRDAGGVTLRGGHHDAVSPAAPDDLVQLGLLRVVRRTPTGARVLDLSTEARPFYQRLLRERGEDHRPRR